MKKGIAVKAFVLGIVFFAFLFIFNEGKSEAATTSPVSAAVQKAELSAEVLRKASTIGNGYKGDGKKQPVAELNAANNAVTYANKLVNRLPLSKRKPYFNRLNVVDTKIRSAKFYIDAILSGKKIVAEKEFLEKQRTIDAETVKIHKDLTIEITKQDGLLNRINDEPTKDSLVSLYKNPGEKVRDEFKVAVDVEEALLLIETGSPKEELASAKTVLLKIHTVPQPAYEQSLYLEWNRVKGRVTLSDPEFTNLVELDSNLNELNSLIQPGISTPKVPVLYRSIKEEFGKLTDEAAKTAYSKALDKAMKPLFLSVKEIKEIITQKAIEKGIPPEVAKAIVLTENGNLQQFTDDGEVFKSYDNGYGIMQVTQQSENDSSQNWNEIKYNVEDNIEAGMKILRNKWDYSLPTINNHEMDVLENWYFAIMAYNGLSQRNIPGGSQTPYQDKVYAIIGEKVEKVKIADGDISFDANSGRIIFNKMNYTTSMKTKTNQFAKINDTIITTNDVKFRSQPLTDLKTMKGWLEAGTKFTILEGPIQDDNMSNLFSWYKIKLTTTGEVGYVSSLW